MTDIHFRWTFHPVAQVNFTSCLLYLPIIYTYSWNKLVEKTNFIFHIKWYYVMNLDENINLFKPTHSHGRSHNHQDSILHFPKCPHILSICRLEYTASEAPCGWLAGDVMTWPFWKKKYTEIHECCFKCQILKICGHFGKSKMPSRFNVTSTIIMSQFNQIYILTQIHH